MSEQLKARDMIALPGPFRFKVIVLPQQLSEDALLTLTREVLARELGEVTVSSNPSKNGKYMAFTLEMHILVYEEIEVLFTAYNEHPSSVWVM